MTTEPWRIPISHVNPLPIDLDSLTQKRRQKHATSERPKHTQADSADRPRQATTQYRHTLSVVPASQSSRLPTCFFRLSPLRRSFNLYPPRPKLIPDSDPVHPSISRLAFIQEKIWRAKRKQPDRATPRRGWWKGSSFSERQPTHQPSNHSRLPEARWSRLKTGKRSEEICVSVCAVPPLRFSLRQGGW
jgi:hypothetical protein